jgi:molecular chaperone DnaJ
MVLMPMTGTRDYYEILDVARTADATEIKKAFRRKAKELHPDTNKNPEAESQFKELGEAYAALSDPQKRQIYDQYGHEGLRGSGGGGGANDWEFMSEFTDLSDIFSSFFGMGFGGQGGRGGGRKVRRGDDLRHDMSIEFAEAVFGCKQEIEINHLATCEVCDGSGSEAGSGPTGCPSCGGRGQVRQTAQTILGQFVQVVTCPTCSGAGQVVKNPCKPCKGQGRTPQKKKITLTIPAGVDNGNRLRVTGEGDAGPQGGVAGDLYVVLNVEPHKELVREEQDLFCKVPVSYSQLALGDTIEVPLLKGKHTLKVPAGSANGKVFSVKGEGVPYLNNPNHRGDLHIELDVQVPRKLGGEERKLLERLRVLEAERFNHSEHDKSHPSFLGKLREALLG